MGERRSIANLVACLTVRQARVRFVICRVLAEAHSRSQRLSAARATEEFVGSRPVHPYRAFVPPCCL
jgi:predicted AAA+ superfamily ATPase